LQQTPNIEEFLISDMKYLQKINSNYYIVIRLGNKVYKKTLRTSNLKKANIRKIRILQYFKDKLNMNNFTMSNDQLQVITIIEEDDDVEEAKKAIKSINQTAFNEVSNSDKLNALATKTEEEIRYSMIEEEVENFYKDYRKTNSDINAKNKEEEKEKVEKRIKEFESTFKYLYLKFPPQTRLLHILNYEDWDNFRDFLIALPNNALRRYGTKKHGTDIQSIIDNIVNEFEEKGEEPVLLNTRTINKHFNIFSMICQPYIILIIKNSKQQFQFVTSGTDQKSVSIW